MRMIGNKKNNELPIQILGNTNKLLSKKKKDNNMEMIIIRK